MAARKKVKKAAKKSVAKKSVKKKSTQRRRKAAVKATVMDNRPVTGASTESPVPTDIDDDEDDGYVAEYDDEDDEEYGY